MSEISICHGFLDPFFAVGWAYCIKRFCYMIMLQSNPENTVGVMTMAGKGVRVLVTPTSDLGKILACMHGMSALFHHVFTVLFFLIFHPSIILFMLLPC